MKILLLTWACDREDVSEPAVTYRWAREIAKHHEVTVFAVSRPERFGCVKEQFPDLPVIEWRDIQVPRSLERFRAIVKPGYFFYYKKARKLLKKILSAQHFDIIHHLTPFAWRYASPAHGLGPPLVRGPIAGGLVTPAVLAGEIKETLHPYKFLRNTDHLRKKLDLNLISSYRETDCVLLAAPYVLDVLAPLPIRRYEVEVELGLEPSTLACPPPRRKNGSKIRLLYVGRIIRTKGVRDAIRAVAFMKAGESIEFTIIGDGEDLAACKREAKSLNVHEIIRFQGWRGQDEVRNAYQEADIFVFPSFREPTGGVLLEAMSYGLPCVTCDYGGPAYLVDDSSGIRIPPSEPMTYARQLAVALDNLASDEQLRIRLSEGARRHAITNFAWAGKMQRLTAIYQSLII
jgi:glycosyltransferase involved in cell wall biosynthesis